MNISSQISKHLREVYFGGNWTGSNLKDNLAGINYEQATTKVHSFNTIAALVFHMNYYVSAVIKVLQNQPLKAHDKNSFDLSPIRSKEDWEELLRKSNTEAETLAGLIEQLPDSRLMENMADEKYGSLYRNLHGIIEHCHYHTGQIALIRKIIFETSEIK